MSNAELSLDRSTARPTAGGALLLGESVSVPRLPRRDQVEGETCQRQGEYRVAPTVHSIAHPSPRPGGVLTRCLPDTWRGVWCDASLTHASKASLASSRLDRDSMYFVDKTIGLFDHGVGDQSPYPLLEPSMVKPGAGPDNHGALIR